MKHSLPDQDVETIFGTLAKFPEVQRAVLFGSRAKGCARAGSDIDLLLEGDAVDRLVLSRLEIALDDSLLPYRFSLCARTMLTDPDLIAHIERVGVTFYERSTLRSP